MHAAIKVIIGLILIIIGLGLFGDSPFPPGSETSVLGFKTIIKFDWLGSFITVLGGVIPIFLILIGLFVVWLELDELKAGKEFEEEKKPKK